jgi:hypothetical protein
MPIEIQGTYVNEPYLKLLDQTKSHTVSINFETVNEVFVEYEIEVYFNNTEEPQTIKNRIRFTRKIEKQWRYNNETAIHGIYIEDLNWQEIENLE